ncbi:hypothetical protein DFH11DRAFT_1730844 [Phellopilus nigrolimitatus]|nr:hypothetical protein DFH11DRAFT_1730844 [Phellopilus nigrolimitatus]
MKFLKLIALASLSLSVAALIPPVYYPSNGSYYVYNVQFQLFFTNAHNTIAEGNPIVGYPMTPNHYTNEQILVETTDSDSGSNIVTLRVLETAQEDPDAGGYCRNSGGVIEHSVAAESWTLQPVNNEALQFRIVDNGLAITLDNGTKYTQLTAETVNDNAENQRWVFVPVDQIADFNAENGVPIQA